MCFIKQHIRFKGLSRRGLFGVKDISRYSRELIILSLLPC
jgi:hypothetical protein